MFYCICPKDKIIPVDNMKYLELEKRIYRLEQSFLAFVALTTGEAKRSAKDMKELEAVQTMLSGNLKAMATMEFPPK
jgi:hypothetical protein